MATYGGQALALFVTTLLAVLAAFMRLSDRDGDISSRTSS
jgi:hypothetical protein